VFLAFTAEIEQSSTLKSAFFYSGDRNPVVRGSTPSNSCIDEESLQFPLGIRKRHSTVYKKALECLSERSKNFLSSKEDSSSLTEISPLFFKAPSFFVQNFQVLFMAPKRTSRGARSPSPPTRLPSPTPVEEREAGASAPRTTEDPPTMELPPISHIIAGKQFSPLMGFEELLIFLVFISKMKPRQRARLTATFLPIDSILRMLRLMIKNQLDS
jgi:hypothetical protein